MKQGTSKSIEALNLKNIQEKIEEIKKLNLNSDLKNIQKIIEEIKKLNLNSDLKNLQKIIEEIKDLNLPDRKQLTCKLLLMRYIHETKESLNNLKKKYSNRQTNLQLTDSEKSEVSGVKTSLYDILNILRSLDLEKLKLKEIESNLDKKIIPFFKDEQLILNEEKDLLNKAIENLTSIKQKLLSHVF
ncbi:hypothetical protein ACRRVD_02155 [Candidatus Cardinium hertigii]|uniref:hypothetical protein n=1 Tax=Candidatus Cardinium hertigii TaxID=247481 RepID=UPI003D7ED440